MTADKVVMTQDELSKLLESAAEAGASRALRTLGLHDDDAPKDLHELRNLLDSWRQVRKGALETFGKLITTAILTSLIAGAAVWYIKH